METGPLSAPRLAPSIASSLPDPSVDFPRFLEGVATQGDVVGFWYGGRERVLVNLPDIAHSIIADGPDASRVTPITEAARRMMGDGLVTSAGADWRPRRVLIQKELSYQNVRRHADVFVRNTLQRLSGWASSGEVDIEAEILELALDNLGDAVFASDFAAFRAIIRRAVHAIQRLIDSANVPGGDVLAAEELEQSVADLDGLVQRMILDRRLAPESGRDVLGVLVEAVGRGEPAFHDRWVRDEVVTLILAGHETTAFTATMAVYLLARNPEVRAILRQQLQDALERGVPLSRLADEVLLTRYVIEESLRLYPPIAALNRTAVEDIDIAGYRIPAGTILVLSQWVTQRDQRFFDEPSRFDPWRFTPERRRAFPRHAYFPFGAGPRICAGNHFALLEAALIVALTTLCVDLEPLVDGEPRLVELGTTLHCADGFRVRVRAIQKLTMGTG